MKKIYLMPETEVIKVGLTAIIAASDPDVTVNKDDETIEAGAVESRRRNSVWEDEEEEEEF